MGVLVGSGSRYVQRLRGIVFNKSQKFITAQQELDALNEAAIQVASELGGLQFTDTSLVTVLGQADYTVPNTWLQVYFLELVSFAGTPQEKAEKVFVTPYPRLQDFSSGSQTPPGLSRYATFNRNARILHIEPAPEIAGKVIRAQVFGMPNEFLNTNSLVDGPIEQMKAICYMAASSLRDLTRDTQEAVKLASDAREAIERAVMARSKMNRVGQIPVGDVGNPEHNQRY